MRNFVNHVSQSQIWCRMFVRILVMVAVSLTLVSCNHTTSQEKATITGRLQLLGAETHEGIKVCLYAPATIDADLEEATQNSELITLAVGQIHVFDYWKQEPLSSALTDVNGDISLVTVPGVYNIAIVKDGFSTTIKYSVNVTSGDQNLSVLIGEELVMNPVIHVSGVYTEGTYNWTEGTDVVVDSDTHFLEGTTLSIAEGANIYIADNSALHIHGNLICQSTGMKPIVFNVIPSSNPSGDFDSIRLYDTAEVYNNTLEWIVVKNAATGLKITGSSLDIYSSYFYCTATSLSLDNCADFNINNSIINTQPVSSNYALDLTNCTSVQIQNSIIFGGNYGARLNVVEDGVVDNCFIRGKLLGVSMEYDSSVVVSHNWIQSNTVGVRAYLRTWFDFDYNDLIAPLGFDIAGAYTTGSFNFNNFDCANTAIKYLAHYGGDLDATMCFWNTVDPDEIQGLIFDKNDVEPNHQYYNRYNVIIYSPYRTTRVTSAGPR